MNVKVYPANRQRAFELIEKIKGIGRAANGWVYIEYEDFRGRSILAATQASPDSLVSVWHTCPAEKSSYQKGCWHLGAALIALGKDAPIFVELTNSKPEPADIVEDLTSDILGQAGSFEILSPKETNRQTAPLPPVVSDEDSWLLLTKYRLPVAVLNKVLEFRERQRLRLTPEQLARVPKPEYIPSGMEFARAVGALVYGEGGDEWEPPLLIGPKGSGKSTFAETLAAVLMLPVCKIFGGIDVNAEALLGSKTLAPVEGIDVFLEAKLRAGAKAAGIDPEPLVQRLRGAQLRVSFEVGLLLNAVQAGEMVVIDEVNMLVPEVTSLLHGLLDWQKVLFVPGYGQVKAHECFRLVACMNPGYQGTHPLNEAFQDRFRSVQVPHLPQNTLAELIRTKTGCPEGVAAQLANVFAALSERVKNGDISDRVLSVRSLLRAAREHMDGYGELREIARSALVEEIDDKFEADQVADLIEAHLGVTA